MTRRRFLQGATTLGGAAGTPASNEKAQVVGSAATASTITALFSVTVKKDKAREFRALAQRLTRVTRNEDDGCLVYVFLQQQDNAEEYVLFEQWRDQKALDSHIAHLQSLLGPPGAGGRIPKAFLDMCEKASAVRYRPLA
jgi:quinol monooxygenase YgiN